MATLVGQMYEGFQMLSMLLHKQAFLQIAKIATTFSSRRICLGVHGALSGGGIQGIKGGREGLTCIISFIRSLFLPKLVSMELVGFCIEADALKAEQRIQWTSSASVMLASGPCTEFLSSNLSCCRSCCT